MLFIDVILGFAIGLALGLLGGGGSILTVPALVYIVGQTPQMAVTASLVIVGANSAAGAFFHRSQGTMNWRIALIFGGTGMISAYFAAGLSKSLSPHTLMIMFAILMLVVGLTMISRKPPQCQPCEARGLFAIIAGGAGVGLVTGFLGVGGGFLIVPALVLLVGLPIQQAVGTSLVVIVMNSLAGFLGHLSGLTLDLEVVIVFVSAGIAGAFLGSKLVSHVQPDRLRHLFAIFVIILAMLLLYDNIF